MIQTTTPIALIASSSSITPTNTATLSATLPDAVTPLCLIVITAIALTHLATKLRLPAIIGSIAAGVLLGPMVLGQLQPNIYQSLFVGGQAEQQLVAEHDNKIKNQRSRLEATGVSEIALEEFDARANADRSKLELRLQNAQDQHATPIRLTLALAALIFIASVVLTNLPSQFTRSQLLKNALPIALTHLLITTSIIAALASIGLLDHETITTSNSSTPFILAALLTLIALPTSKSIRSKTTPQHPELVDQIGATRLVVIALMLISFIQLTVARQLQSNASTATDPSELLHLTYPILLAIIFLAFHLTNTVKIKRHADPLTQRLNANALPLSLILLAIVTLLIINLDLPLIWIPFLVALGAAKLNPQTRRRYTGDIRNFQRTLGAILVTIATLTHLHQIPDNWYLIIAIWLLVADIKIVTHAIATRLLTGGNWKSESRIACHFTDPHGLPIAVITLIATNQNGLHAYMPHLLAGLAIAACTNRISDHIICKHLSNKNL